MFPNVRHVLRASLALLLFVLLPGCSKPQEQAIVGEWADIDHPAEKATFYPNHMFVMGNPNGAISGTWEKIGDDVLRIETSGRDGSPPIRFEKIRFSGDVMTLHSQMGESRFRRQ